MDHHSFDSEVIESLNHLRPPPVRKCFVNTNRDFCVNCFTHTGNNLRVLRAFNHKSQTSKSVRQTTHADSSTSLILKKTSHKQILQTYTVNSATNLHCNQEYSYQNNSKYIENEKPLIKVTVIPKSSRNKAARLFRRQKVVTKSIHNTSSNHENSIQTKNVYLVVAGRKKDKVYEIKTTGSASLANELIKEDDVNLCRFKQFIKTFNMEKKKKKEKKNEDKNNETQMYNSLAEHVCRCTKAPEEYPDVRPGKSRVRIFGRIGVTGGDKYVLKCQATVNDKPVQVPTSSSTAEKQLSSGSLVDFYHNRLAASPKVIACVREMPDSDHRDSIMQTDFRMNAVNEILMNIDYRNNISKESQSTQVNFNKPRDRSPYPRSERITQCNCGTSADFPSYPVKKDSNDYGVENQLKSCQSPLVIISVFPKQENLAEIVKTVQRAQIDTRRSTVPEILDNIQDNIMDEDSEPKTTTKKSIRSRSPPPKGFKSKSKDKPKNKKATEIRNVKTSERNASPLRSKILKKELKKEASSQKQTMQFCNSNNKETINNKAKTSPPSSPRSKSPPTTMKRETQKTIDTPRQSLKNKSKSPVAKHDKGINTEHLKTKKALVETYTKKICEKMSTVKDKPLVNDISKVSVNIDSENDYYDVSFRRDRYTTDLNVRKTMKEASTQKLPADNERHGSIENLLSKSKKQRRSSLCKSFCENLSNETLALVKKPSRLTTRDSLEISHRREDKSLKKTQTRRICDQPTTNSETTEYLAPIKHYTGDKCSICDPVERDREIRELLGVEGRRNNSQTKESPFFKTSYETSRHCLYPNQCKNTFVTGLALNQIFPCVCTHDESEQSVHKTLTNNEKKTLSKKKSPTKTDVSLQCPCMSNQSVNQLTETYEEPDSVSPQSNTDDTEGSELSKRNEIQRQSKQPKYYPKLSTECPCSCTDILSDRSANISPKTYNEIKTESKSLKKYSTEDLTPTNQNEERRQSKQKSNKSKINKMPSTEDPIPLNQNEERRQSKQSKNDSKNYKMSSTEYPTPTKQNEERRQSKQSNKMSFNENPVLTNQNEERRQSKQATNDSKSNKMSSTEDPTPTNQNEERRQRKQTTNNSMDNKISSTEDPTPTNQNEERRQSKQATNDFKSNKMSSTEDLTPTNQNEAQRQSKQTTNDSKSNRISSTEDPAPTNQNEEQRQSKQKTRDTTSIHESYENAGSKSHKHFVSRIPKLTNQNESRSKQKSDDLKYKTESVPTDVPSTQTVNNNKLTEKRTSKSNEKHYYGDPKPTNQSESRRQSKQKPNDAKYNNQSAPTDVPSAQSGNKLPKSEKNKSKSNRKYSSVDPKMTNQSEKQHQSKEKAEGIFEPGKNLEARTSIYQQLTLNRNVQVFLQVEQFSKQKPIILSRKQYQKVRRTIQKTISKDKSKRCSCNHSIVSVGEVREKPQNDVLIYFNREVQTEFWSYKDEKENRISKLTAPNKSKHNEFDTVVLYSNDARGSVKDRRPEKASVRQAVSSMEVRYSSVAYLKHVTFSSTNMGSVGSSSYARRNQHSIETLFRGHRKSATPNLGTSAFSLLSDVENISESKSMIDAKNKKPFLKRLMSCLVMRSKTSERKDLRVNLPPTENSSVDSYHLSTSLAVSLFSFVPTTTPTEGGGGGGGAAMTVFIKS